MRCIFIVYAYLYSGNCLYFVFIIGTVASAGEDGTAEELVDRNCPPCRVACHLWPVLHRAWLRYQTWIASVLTHAYFERLVALIIALNVTVLVRTFALQL